jgi:hypothetical protein
MFKRFSSPKKEERKRVSFSEERDILQVDKFENKEELWVTSCEAHQFMTRDMKIAQLLRQMSPYDMEIRTGQSSRGLEHTDEEVWRSFRRRRTSSVMAVMSMQQLFQRQGKDGQNSIARAYGLVSESAVQPAIELAGEDAQFVNDHIRKELTAENRIFEKRSLLPSVMGRQSAFRPFLAVAQ